MAERPPHDLHLDILVSLPVKSLLRFQCVSKSWMSLIGSTGFISLHTKHNESTDNYAHVVFGYLSQTDNDNKNIGVGYKLNQFDDSFSELQKLKFPSETRGKLFDEVIDCRGLLLLTNPNLSKGDSVESFILWNPAVRMSITLPRPCFDVPFGNHDYYVHGFGYDHRSNDYKVLRMLYTYNDCRTSPYRAELFKLRPGTWETVSVNDDFHSTKPDEKYGSSQVFMNGASHWVGYRKIRRAYLDSREIVILLFHMCDEEFQVMQLPDVLASLPQPYSLVVSDGLLSLIQYNPRRNSHLGRGYDGCCIWSMKEYGVTESWTKQYTIDLRDRDWMEVLSFRNKSKILIVTSSKELLLYDLKTQRFVSPGIKKRHYFPLSMHICIESLVLLNEVNAVREYQNSSWERMQLTKVVREDLGKHINAI